MPIKVEILADNAAELFAQLRGMMVGVAAVDLTAQFKADQKAINEAAPVEAAKKPKPDPITPIIDPPKPTKPKPGKPKNGSGVKPLPVDDDPLSVTAAVEANDADDFLNPPDEPATTPGALLEEAIGKLRDLFRVPNGGTAGIRRLKEKYNVNTFVNVPMDRAEELWADAIALEKELGA